MTLFTIWFTSSASVCRAEDDVSPISMRGLASWYSSLEGRSTASGRPLNDGEFTAASTYYPCGTLLYVSVPKTGKGVLTVVSDYGPHPRFTCRVVDLSKRTFAELAPLKQGLVEVEVSVVAMPPPGLNRRERVSIALRYQQIHRQMASLFSRALEALFCNPILDTHRY